MREPPALFHRPRLDLNAMCGQVDLDFCPKVQISLQYCLTFPWGQALKFLLALPIAPAKLPPVKFLRIFLLLLLAVLLPIRGAAAAAMQCEPDRASSHAELQVHAHGSSHASAGMHDHHQMGHEHGTKADDARGGTSGASEKCSLCCDLCSVTPLASSLPAVPVPQGVASTSFPALSAPSPSFVSEGQERPPRSI